MTTTKQKLVQTQNIKRSMWEGGRDSASVILHEWNGGAADFQISKGFALSFQISRFVWSEFPDFQIVWSKFPDFQIVKSTFPDFKLNHLDR